MDRECVAQRMRRDRFAETGLLKCLSACDLDGTRRDGLLGPVTWKQPLLWTGRLPLVSQKLQQRLREHHLAVLPAVARLPPDAHPLAVNCGGLQGNRLEYPQPR